MTRWIQICLLVAGLIPLVATSGELEKHKALVLVAGDADPLRLELDDLKDGETRTFEQDGKTIIVTRTGNDLSVTVDGESLDSIAQKHVFVRSASDTDEASDGASKMMFWHAEVGDGLQAEEIRERIRAEGLPEPSGDALIKHAPQSLFRCPSDGAELRVKDENAAGPFLCPIDGQIMERVKDRVRVFGYSFKEKSAESAAKEAPGN